MPGETTSKICKVLPPSVLVTANLFVFGTFSVYQGNMNEFEVGFLRLFSAYALPCVLLLTVFLLAGLILPSRASEAYASGLCIWGILLWVQGSFLMGDYGVLDGRQIDWDESVFKGWVDLSVWIVALGASIAFSRYVAEITSYASWMLLALQATLVVGLSVTAEEGLWIREYRPEKEFPKGLHEYSSSQNIVHVVLDSFQTDIFWDLVVEQQLEQYLEGFVLFKENAGAAPHTSLSIPAIFSGRIYDGGQSPASYYRESIIGGFQNRLYDEGYVVNLAPHESMRISNYSNYYDIPSIYGGTLGDVVRANAARLLDGALFRQSPHCVRKQIYNDNNWLVTPLVSGSETVPSLQEKVFFRNYIQNIHVTDSKPAYHFMHLIPPHPPYVTRRDGSYAGSVLSNTRDNYKSEARAILKLFLDLLNRLRQLGLYESSLIILQGDHGSQIAPIVDGKEIETCAPRLAALLTVKLPGSSGPLKVSNAPTSLLDIPATVMKVVGIDSVFPGSSVFEIDSTQPRRRHFVEYHGGDGPEITRYSIDGSVFSPEVCLDEGRVAVSGSRPKYHYGTEIRFGLMGNADPFFGFGWSWPMSRSCWNNGHRANLHFALDPQQSDLVFKVNLVPYIQPGKVTKQTIHLFANGTRIGEWTAIDKTMYSFLAHVPKGLVDSSELVITFEFPNAVSPKSIGEGGDIRKLAVDVYSASLDIQPAYQYGAAIRFGTNGNADPFLGRGWSSQNEAGLRWTHGQYAELHIPVHSPGSDIVLQATLMPYIYPERVPKQNIHVFANGTKIGEWMAKGKEPQTFMATIPRRLVRNSTIRIGLQLPDAVSPRSIGAGSDARTLAIAMLTAALKVSTKTTDGARSEKP